MTNINPIVKKLKKMMALADDQAGTPEGELAAKLAAKMMREHAISMSEINDVSLEADPLVEDRLDVGRVTWRMKLVWALANHCNVKALRMKVKTPGKGSNKAVARLFGHKTDIEILHYLYDICERQIQQALKKWKKERTARGLRNLYGDCQSYRESAVWGLSVKLQEIRDAGKAEDPQGTALVLSRAQKSDEFMLARCPKIGKYKGGSKSDFNRDGYKAGLDIKLHKGVEGPKKDEIKETKRIEGGVR